MALQSKLAKLPPLTDDRVAIVRIRAADLHGLEKHLYQRYPMREWGTFFRFGYRRTSWGMAISFIDGLWPRPGDLDRQTALTTFCAGYSRRAFQVAAESQGLGIGVAHSHPVGCQVKPSGLDDDMDSYFGREITAFGKGSPYCSLIFERGAQGGLTFSGRIFDRGEWLSVESLMVVGKTIDRHQSALVENENVRGIDFQEPESPRARLAALMGEESKQRLENSVVGVIGCSGTGSPAVGVLTRAGIGEFVLVDPQRFSASNLERLHGAEWCHLQLSKPPYKVDLMRDLIGRINPYAKVTTFAGNVLCDNVIDELLRCDVLLGCTDSNHGRVGLSDMAQHFLLPSIDLGIGMDGQGEKVLEQVSDITQFGPDLPCAFCGQKIDTTDLAYELMSEAEKESRMRDAEVAVARGLDPDQYWRRRPRQLHTVGYLTTALGALGAGYIEGWLTGAFEIPHSTFQFDIGRSRFGLVAPPRTYCPKCNCGKFLGWGDLAKSYRNVVIPSHWPKRAILTGAVRSAVLENRTVRQSTVGGV